MRKTLKIWHAIELFYHSKHFLSSHPALASGAAGDRWSAEAPWETSEMAGILSCPHRTPG